MLKNEEIRHCTWNICDTLNNFACAGAMPVLYASEYVYEMEPEVAKTTLANLRSLVWELVFNLRQIDAHARAKELTREAEGV